MSTLTETEEAPVTRKVAIQDMKPRVLDWLIAKLLNPEWGEEGWTVHTAYPDDDSGWVFQPTRHWEQGGQLMQKYGVSIHASWNGSSNGEGHWVFQGTYLIPFDDIATDPYWRRNNIVRGQAYDSALLAAMSMLACILMKTGPKAEVEVPEEVLNEA